MDTFVTGKPPVAAGPPITVRFRQNLRSSYRDGDAVTCNCGQLISTSNYFHNAVSRVWATAPSAPSVEFVWSDPAAFASYIQWTQDRIVHRFPAAVTLAPAAGKDNGGKAAAAAIEEKTIEDYDTLIRLWLLGHKVQDVTYQDITMTMLEENVRLPNRSFELFCRALTPALVHFVYTSTTYLGYANIPMRRFIVDTVAEFAGRERIETFLSDTGPPYQPEFVTELSNRLMKTAPLHILPTWAEPYDSRMKRVLLPLHSQTYTDEMIGEPTIEHVSYRLPPRDPNMLSGREVERLVAWTISRKKVVDKCRYHQHGDSLCWWKQLE